MQIGTFKQYDHDNDHWDERFFSLPEEHLLKHIYVVGMTGVGKTTFLENIIGQLSQGRGFVLLDPHGDLAEKVLQYIPPSRVKDTIYIDPSDTDYPLGFNILERVPYNQRSLVRDSVVQSFKHIFDSWGPQLEQILTNACAAMLDYPNGTLLGIYWLLTSPHFRKRVIPEIIDPIVRNFWEVEYPALEKERPDVAQSTLNKLNPFLTDRMMRNILAQPKSFPIQFGNQIIIANLTQGKIGFGNSDLLGSLLMAKIHSAALARKDRTPYYLVLDEFQNFGTTSFLEMLSGLRKFGVALVLANQYLTQLDEQVRDAVLNTVGTVVAFRTGPDTAKVLAPYFERPAEDFTDLEPFRALVRNGKPTQYAMPLPTFPTYPSSPLAVRNRTRTLATRREHIEYDVMKFIATNLRS